MRNLSGKLGREKQYYRVESMLIIISEYCLITTNREREEIF
jgi:hypothetical protein